MLSVEALEHDDSAAKLRHCVCRNRNGDVWYVGAGERYTRLDVEPEQLGVLPEVRRRIAERTWVSGMPDRLGHPRRPGS